MKQIYIKISIIIVLLMIITYIQFPYIKKGIAYINKKEINENKEIIVNIQIENKTIKKNLDDYLLGVVAGEMPAEFELEALKAQVVASRTFVLSRNLKVDNTTNSQVYLTESQMKKNWGSKYNEYKNKIKKAIKETNNEVMTYK